MMSARGLRGQAGPDLIRSLSMAYKVRFSIPGGLVGVNDFCFNVEKDGEILGRLQVSKGRLDWFPGKASKRGHSMSWARFAEVMEDRPVRRAKRRRRPGRQ
jgi:hypothetical protein